MTAIERLRDDTPAKPWQVSGVRSWIGGGAGQPVLSVGEDGAPYTVVVLYSDLTPEDHIASHRDARSIVNGIRLTRTLVAEGEREIIARIIDPDAFDVDGQNDDTADRFHRRGRAFRTADALLEHFAAMALGEGE